MSTATETANGAGPPNDATSLIRPLHPQSFKLRFATQRELGRSYVSALKPLTLPATVATKFYSAVQGAEGAGQREAKGTAETEARARVSDLFRRGPRERYRHPVTSSHEYGWWWEHGGRWHESEWLHHHICDSAWLKTRLRVLAADASYKR